MKKLVTAFLFSLSFSASSYGSEKLCTGTADFPEFQGFELHVSVSDKRIVVSPMPSNHNQEAFTGTFESNRGRRTSQGSQQLGFDGYDEGGGDEFWVDSNLLQPNSSGRIDVTNTNEGQVQAAFSCRDSSLK